MSTTATMTMTAPPVVEPVTTLSTAPCCPQCGIDLEGTQPFEEMQAAVLDAHNKIQELQNQVRLLNEKASSAVDRWADYEDEITRLRGQLKQQQQQQQSQSSPSQISSPPQQQAHTATALATPPQSATPSTTATANASPASAAAPRSVGSVASVSSFLPTGAASRLSAFLTSRKSTPNLKSGTPPSTGPIPHMPTHQSTLSQAFTSQSPLQQPFQSTPSVQHQKELSDLQTALSTEKSAHTETRVKLAKAEAKLTATSREIEELSVTLFSEANEMVASERRARAKLEERVKTLEKRDEQKKERLEMLEGAVRRMERVREVLKETERVERGLEGGGLYEEETDDEGRLPVSVVRRENSRLDLDD